MTQMTLVKRIFGTSVGAKQVVGIMSLIWCIFLVFHLLGNFYLFFNDGGDAFNHYAEKLESLGYLLILAEIGLVAALLLHLVFALKLALDNIKARQNLLDRYQVTGSKGGMTPASMTMAITGPWILIFILIHLVNFKVAYMSGGEDHTLYDYVVNVFNNPIYVGYYVISVAIVGVHVAHGLQSAFQTLGIYSVDIKSPLEMISTVFGVVIAIGYAAIPIFMLIKGGA